jgi:hypothetical protein
MNKKRISEIFSNDRFTLYAVESVDVSHTKTAAGFTWQGNLKPTAIIIHRPGKNQALDMEANPIELEKLKESIPELERIENW